MLAKAGWFGGNPSTVNNAPVDVVIKAFQFEIMTREFESTSYELNKGEQ